MQKLATALHNLAAWVEKPRPTQLKLAEARLDALEAELKALRPAK